MSRHLGLWMEDTPSSPGSTCPPSLAVQSAIQKNPIPNAIKRLMHSHPPFLAGAGNGETSWQKLALPNTLTVGAEIDPEQPGPRSKSWWGRSITQRPPGQTHAQARQIVLRVRYTFQGASVRRTSCDNPF